MSWPDRGTGGTEISKQISAKTGCDQTGL